MISLEQRAKEISDFLGVPFEDAAHRIMQGFHFNHKEVADDFKAANPTNDELLLSWYRNTTGYIYELTTYHLIEDHYDNRSRGIAVHLKNLNKPKVLVVGDGIGDLSIVLKQQGVEPTYHDLADSKTAGFAQYRFEQMGLSIQTEMTVDFMPTFPVNTYDAVVAYDFMEHLPEQDVPLWTLSLYNSLVPGGIFQTENAFGIGLHNLEDGTSSIPQHEASGEKWVTGWVPLLNEIGFIDMKNGWWIKI